MKKIFNSILLTSITLSLNTQVLKHHLVGWYPTDPQALEQKIKQLDATAHQIYQAPTDPKIRAIIVPHAGYTYSGAVAAAAYRLLDPNQYDTAIVICPSHSAQFDGIALSSTHSTHVPNGTLVINQEFTRELAQKPPFLYHDQAFAHEHAIEIQLPLIKHYLKKITIVPMIIGTVTKTNLEKAAQELAKFITDKTLVIVSTDFTHYGTRFGYTPFENHQSLRIKQLDNQALTLIQKQDPEAFSSFIAQTKAPICGHEAIKLLLHLIKSESFKDIESRIIAYAQSTPVQNNTQESVSYAALTFTKQKLEKRAAQQQFNQFERTELLALARTTLEQLFSKQAVAEAVITTPALTSTRGAFVTLKTKKTPDLRGCIGNIIGYQPLIPTITRLTQDAALHDTRFNPVTVTEIPQLAIEISILTPPKRIQNTKEIMLGKHGIILHYQNQQAVYLPEVATEQGWDLATTLGSLSQKAGLPEHAWRDTKTWFEVFESIKFGES